MKTRFCPSPTGRMHLGNARTALFSKLWALHQGQGCFLLRLEDTDASRSTHEYREGLKEDLHWLGLIWDEGPDAGGEQGPYQQSQRQPVYQEYYHQLIAEGHAYPCFCTPQALKKARDASLAAGQPPRYLGTCRQLSKKAIEDKKASGLQPVLRFKMPQTGRIGFMDGIKGEQYAPAESIGDFVIQRAEGTPTFLFCNALDDALMGVSHVLRGEDHLSNTFRQIALLQALGLTPPHYSHMPLILGYDRAPLSKRNGSQSIADLRQAGFHPLALINYLARLGHTLHTASTEGSANDQTAGYQADTQTAFFLPALAQQFSLQGISRSAACFDEDQLMYWQKQVVLSLDNMALWAFMGEAVQVWVTGSGHDDDNVRDDFIQVVRDNIMFPHDALVWARVFFDEASLDTFISSVASKENKAILFDGGKAFFECAKQSLLMLQSQSALSYDAWVKCIQSETGKKGKALYWPLRMALTGHIQGPGFKAIVDLFLQRRFNQLIRRLEQAIATLDAETTNVS